MLFAVITVVAIVVAFTATHFRVVIGAAVAAMWLLDFVADPILNFVDAWPELKGPKLAKPPDDSDG